MVARDMDLKSVPVAFLVATWVFALALHRGRCAQLPLTPTTFHSRAVAHGGGAAMPGGE